MDTGEPRPGRKKQGPMASAWSGALAWVVCLAVQRCVCAWGQAAGSPPTEPARPYVLHVYEDLVQVPTLVLTSAHEAEQGLGVKAFDVQLDGGPKFHPRAARPEANDPLSVSILLDARHGEHQELVRALAAAIPKLPENLFQPEDHLSVFAYDCSVVTSGVNGPATLPALRSGVVSALAAPGLHGEKVGTKLRCPVPVHLWDAVGTVVNQVNHLPGRRVLLVVSDGMDFGSKLAPETVRTAAGGEGLAIFGIEPEPPQRPVLVGGIPSKLMMETAMNDAFGMVCGGSGGLLIGSTAHSLDADLVRLFALVRERYVLEFSRPRRGAAAGLHVIEVTVSDPSAVVRPSGVTVAMQDPAQLSDPNTVPRNASEDPVLGKGARKR